MIQFIYVQKKDNLEEFIIIFKENIKDIYEAIYSILYNTISNTNINYIKLFYIKKGLVIEYNDNIWNKILKLYYKNLNIVKLIDSEYLISISNNNYLDFDYKKNKK